MDKSKKVREEIHARREGASQQYIKKFWPNYWPSSTYTINQFNNETERIFPNKKKQNETKTWRQTTFL